MVVLVTACSAATIVIVESTAIASIFSLFSIAFFICADVVPDLLILFKQEPEHTI